MERLQRVVAALWLGSAFFLMLAASAAFRVTRAPEDAADFVGAMLTRWHYIALAAPLALFAIELRRVRPLVLTILFSALIFATVQGFVDLRIRSLRWSAPVPISSLRAGHPLRRRFGQLHGASMALLALQALAAAAVVMANPSARPPKPRDASGPVSEPRPAREDASGGEPAVPPASGPDAAEGPPAVEPPEARDALDPDPPRDLPETDGSRTG